MLIAKKLLGAALLALSLSASVASMAAPPVEGRDYTLVSPPQPTEGKDKIEVIEFFSYACPHCHAFEPSLIPWIKNLPKDVVFKRIPVTFRDNWAPLTRLYYTLEALGEVDRLHGQVFDALHLDNVNLTDEKIQADWVASKGIDRKKYTDTYNSFTVQSKANRANQISQAYQVKSVPTLTVGGKFMTSQAQAGGSEAVLRVVDELIAKLRGKPAKKKTA